MNPQITPQQALNNLYQASRKAPLTADEHNLVLQCAKIIEDIITPKQPTQPKDLPKNEEKIVDKK